MTLLAVENIVMVTFEFSLDNTEYKFAYLSVRTRDPRCVRFVSPAFEPNTRLALPLKSVSISSDITVMFLDCSDGGNPYQSVRFTSRIVRVLPVLSLDAYGLYTGLFFIVFQPNCARSRPFSNHQFKYSLGLDFDN